MYSTAKPIGNVYEYRGCTLFAVFLTDFFLLGVHGSLNNNNNKNPENTEKYPSRSLHAYSWRIFQPVRRVYERKD